MSKTIKVRTSYTGCPYITAGKVYEAVVLDEFLLPKIMGDHGEMVGIYAFPGKPGHTCGHLDCVGSWEILPEGPSIADELAEALAQAIPPLELYRAYGWQDRNGVIESLINVLAKHKESKQ